MLSSYLATCNFLYNSTLIEKTHNLHDQFIHPNHCLDSQSRTNFRNSQGLASTPLSPRTTVAWVCRHVQVRNRRRLLIARAHRHFYWFISKSHHDRPNRLCVLPNPDLHGPARPPKNTLYKRIGSVRVSNFPSLFYSRRHEVT